LGCNFHRLVHKVTSMQSEGSKQSMQSEQKPYSFRCILSEGTVVVGSTKKYMNIEDGPIDCPETSARNDHYSPRNNPEERGS
jgi:hypothetical protein